MTDEPDLDSAREYLRDAWQRSVLFLDVLRQRGNTYRERQQETAPHVLDFDAELVLDGRTLARPVNYALVRIAPPANVPTDPAKRAFVVVEPEDIGRLPLAELVSLAEAGVGDDPHRDPPRSRRR